MHQIIDLQLKFGRQNIGAIELDTDMVYGLGGGAVFLVALPPLERAIMTPANVANLAIFTIIPLS
jgi:hypothetical protein